MDFKFNSILEYSKYKWVLKVRNLLLIVKNEEVRKKFLKDYGIDLWSFDKCYWQEVAFNFILVSPSNVEARGMYCPKTETIDVREVHGWVSCETLIHELTHWAQKKSGNYFGWKTEYDYQKIEKLKKEGRFKEAKAIYDNVIEEVEAKKMAEFWRSLGITKAQDETYNKEYGNYTIRELFPYLASIDEEFKKLLDVEIAKHTKK